MFNEQAKPSFQAEISETKSIGRLATPRTAALYSPQLAGYDVLQVRQTRHRVDFLVG